MLASEAASLLPDLADGFLAVRPGIFASDDADGRVTLLLSSDPAATSQQSDTQFSDAPFPAGREPEYESGAGALTSAVTHCLDALRWLESLDAHATGAVAHGIGALAGLAWAGALGEREVVEIADLRAQYLLRSASRSGDARRTCWRARPGRQRGSR